MTFILIKKNRRGPESIFYCQEGLRGKMFENHCSKMFQIQSDTDKDCPNLRHLRVACTLDIYSLASRQKYRPVFPKRSSSFNVFPSTGGGVYFSSQYTDINICAAKSIETYTKRSHTNGKVTSIKFKIILD
jgi:hypothetical protein